MRTGTRSVVMGLLGCAGLVCLASSASAQTTRVITVIPIKFQNDQCEGSHPNGTDVTVCVPETPDQIRASIAATSNATGNTLGNLLRLATNDQIRIDVRVLPYVTVPFNRDLSGARTGCWPPSGSERFPSWQWPATQAAIAAGHTVTGQGWAHSPQHFGGQCGELDAIGSNVHSKFRGINLPFIYGTSLGLNTIAWQWLCQDANGGWVAISDMCNGGGLRHFRSMLGQSWGFMSMQERVQLGTLSADRIRTVSAPDAFTLASLSGPSVPPAGVIQAARVPGCTALGINGVTLEYHAPSVFLDNFESAGLTIHVNGTNRMLDATPDGETRPGAGTHALRPGASFTCPSGVRITAGAISAAGIAVTVDTAPVPVGVRCADATVNGVLLPSITVLEGAECAVYAFGGNNVSRNGVLSGAQGSAFVACDGIAHLRHQDDFNLFFRRSGTSWTRLDQPPSCVGSALPPSADLTEGGTATSNETASPVGEGVDRAFDNAPTTKWLTWRASGSWIAYALPAPVVVTSYALTAGAEPGYGTRDPKAWTLEGSNDGAAWTLLDTQSGQLFASQRTRRVYPLTNAASFSRYRFTVTGNNGAAITSLWELELYGSSGTLPPPPPPTWTVVPGAVVETIAPDGWRITANGQTFEVIRKP